MYINYESNELLEQALALIPNRTVSIADRSFQVKKEKKNCTLFVATVCQTLTEDQISYAFQTLCYPFSDVSKTIIFLFF